MGKVQKNIKIILKKLLEHFDYYNKLAPFPLWDTYYTEKLREQIKMSKINIYDEDPVDCCSYCKNIHIVKDEQNNDVCSKCLNIVNEDYETFDNIHDYLEKYGEIWGLKETEDEEGSNYKD